MRRNFSYDDNNMEIQNISDPIKAAQSASQPRDLSGKFSKLDPPLVSFSITNPVTYLRKWWNGVMEGEGVDIKLKIHPFTAVLIVCAVGGVSFGVGRISVPEPIAQYLPILATPLPSATPNPWVPAAFVGKLQKQGEVYFLIGSDTRAVTLQLDTKIDLTKYIGKKILASGMYRADSQVLLVQDASDMEVVTGSVPLMTPSVTPMPTPAQ